MCFSGQLRTNCWTKFCVHYCRQEWSCSSSSSSDTTNSVVALTFWLLIIYRLNYRWYRQIIVVSSDGTGWLPTSNRAPRNDPICYSPSPSPSHWIRRCHELNFLSCTINLCRPIRIICSIHKQVSRLIYFLLFDAIYSRSVFKQCKNLIIVRLYYIMIRSSFLLLHNSNSQSNNKA